MKNIPNPPDKSIPKKAGGMHDILFTVLKLTPYEGWLFTRMSSRADSSLFLSNRSQSLLAKDCCMSVRQGKDTIKRLESMGLIVQIHIKGIGKRKGISGYRIASLAKIQEIVCRLRTEVHNMHHENESEVQDMHHQGAPHAQKLHQIFEQSSYAASVFNQGWFFDYCGKTMNFDYESFLSCADTFLQQRWIGACRASMISISTQKSMIHIHKEFMFHGEPPESMALIWKTLGDWLARGGKDRPRTMARLFRPSEVSEYFQLSQAWLLDQTSIQFPGEAHSG